MKFIIGISSMLLCLGLAAEIGQELLQRREIDEFSKGMMKENGQMRAAAPECKGQLGWVYHKGFCYMFTSYHETFLKAEEECNKVGAYLADVLTEEENNFIKSVLNVINPKDGTDYWLGGLDADKNKGMQWMTGTNSFFSVIFYEANLPNLNFIVILCSKFEFLVIFIQ